MRKRFVSIWFPYLITDWMVRQKPELKEEPFVLSMPERGRMVVKSVSPAAYAKGICTGMVVADCRAIFPELLVLEYPEGKAVQLLKALAEWCIRYSPVTAVDLPDGIILDCSGCTHLWQGDAAYVAHILKRFEAFGYHTRAALADTMAAAWAVSRFGKDRSIIPSGEQMAALLDLPPASLRLEKSVVQKLEKLGLIKVRSFIKMPRSALRKRFGPTLLSRIDQALGYEIEPLEPVQLREPFIERLPSLEPIRTAKGISIAVERLLDRLCLRLEKEGKGLRYASLRCFRVDGNIQQVSIGTNLPTRNVRHLYKLFELKTGQLRPNLGFELFELQANTVEAITVDQITLWVERNATDQTKVAEFLDKIGGKLGRQVIHRYLPTEHYWPERSYKLSESIEEIPDTKWRTDLPRPVHLLNKPARIEVSVRLPDYPPMLFIYNGELHHVTKADGPERIAPEWWLKEDLFRDYYCVEDEFGQRFWLFRSGHYDDGNPEWYLHGFFA